MAINNSLMDLKKIKTHRKKTQVCVAFLEAMKYRGDMLVTFNKNISSEGWWLSSCVL